MMTDQIRDMMYLYDRNTRNLVRAIIKAGGSPTVYDPDMSAVDIMIILARNNVEMNFTVRKPKND